MRYDAPGTPRLTLVTVRVDDNDLRNQQMLIKAAAVIHAHRSGAVGANRSKKRLYEPCCVCMLDRWLLLGHSWSMSAWSSPRRQPFRWSHARPGR